MTELDFDELDKAVNSLMGGVDTSKRNTSLDDPEDKVVALTLSDDAPTKGHTVNVVKTKTTDASSKTTEPADDAAGVAVETAASSNESTAEPETTPISQEPNITPTTPSLAVKRRGQFMDIVHPSSDMKSAPKLARREGITLAPSAAATASASVPSTPESTPVANEPTVLAAIENEPQLDSDIPVSTDTGPAPLVSPFLPDAKPEKRPLGGASLDAPKVENTEDTAVEAQVPPAPEPQILPEELSSDVLAVEANDLTGKTTDSKPVENPAPVELDIADTSPAMAPEQIPPVGGSIPQQYTEAPSTGDQTSGSIYDTANYHQAITAAAPVKKSSPLKWIILAIVLLVVGGAAGVGYYFLTH